MARCIPAFLFPLLALHCLLVEASHFRGGTIRWSPTGADNTLRFIFRLGFRRSSVYCNQSTIDKGLLIGSGPSWTAKCNNLSNPLCQKTSTIASSKFYCTDYSDVEDWSLGENNFTYTFVSSEDEWFVSYSGCCWIALPHVPGDWLVSTFVNLTQRSDTGKINSSPVSRSPAIFRFQEGCSQSFRIPVEDPDGDVVKCRLATYSESKIYNGSFPYGVLDEKSCVLKYDGMKGSARIHAVSLTLEDFPAGTTHFGSVKPFSSVVLQFLVIISNHKGSCDDIPVFTSSTPKDGQCSEVQTGSAYKTIIEVQPADFEKHIVEIATSSPPGMHLTPLRYHGGIYYRNVTWYPSQYQIGKQLFCFKAVDSNRLESQTRCVTILVGLSNTPRVILGSHTPRNPISKSGPGFVRWSIRFDRLIKKPRSSSYIRLVLLPSGHTVYKVDTLSKYVAIDSNFTMLHFEMPNAALSMNGTYAILIDRGAVVGQGCSYDGPPTPGITSVSDWYFSVDGVCPSGYYLASPAFSNCVDVNECEAQPSFKVNSSAQSEFKLHLPSDCGQTCSNTLGSYTCSCVSGYQLVSDGKSCTDIDECSNNNGGCSHHCFNIPGSFYCGCPEGITMASNNLTCVDTTTSVTCSDNNMTMSLEKRTFKFFEASQLHLRYASCRATQNSTHFLISTPLNGCGTLLNETEDALIFWNELFADAVIIDYVVTRTHDLRLPFYCSYSRKALLSHSFTPQRIYFGTEAGYGNFTLKMDFFKSSSFSTPYTNQDYPILVELDDYVYVKYSVESSADLTIMAENCKATKDKSFYSWPQYNIIRNGCPRDATLDYSYDPGRSYQQFKVKVFRFFNDYDTVYFYCELLACHRYSPNSRCSTDCSASNKRNTREVKRDEIEHGESTTKKILTSGPLVIKGNKKSADPGNPGESKQAALIGGVAAAGGFGLIAVAALVVLFAKYRTARRFINRSRAGHLYITQDEQTGMIENDDAL